MRIFLARLGLDRWTDLRVDELESLATCDRFQQHELVDKPEEADAVLFVQCHMVDWRLRAICDHPVARRHWEKVMVYDERDRPWRSFPGVYVSAPASSFDVRRQRAGSYLRVPARDPSEVAEPDLLFSFVGSPTAACRRRLFELRHPDAVVEEVKDFMFWDLSAAGHEEHRRRFRDVLSRSRFVLCPRGRGTSSFRLYETLAAGRVPVIISDEWVAPRGPDWEAFSLRIGERGTGSLIPLLEERDAEWSAMSAEAAVAYSEFFSDEVAFHRLASSLGELHQSRAPRSSRWSTKARAAAASLHESLVALNQD